MGTALRIVNNAKSFLNLRAWLESVSKSLFGLRTTATYKPTNSVIEARTIELSREDGERLKNILTGSHKNLAEAIGNFHPEQVSYGNFMAEVCASRDSAFVAVLLLQFLQLSYEAVTDVLYAPHRLRMAVQRSPMCA